LRYISIARDFGVPVNMEITQFFRATMLYDTIATRLNPDINFTAEFKKYAREAGKDARRRVQKEVRKRLSGPTDTDYLTIEQVGDSINQFFFQWQRLVEDPAVQFKNIVGKVAFAVSLVTRIVYLGVLMAGLAVVTQLVVAGWFGRHIPWSELFDMVASVWWVQLGLVVAGVVLLRHVLGRAAEPDHKPGALHT